MKDSVYEFLKKNIRTKGFYQPIICIEENGRYIIVDGEHRYRAAVEEGL
jgi:ParB-like chromosome segregation protein Spo0J